MFCHRRFVCDLEGLAICARSQPMRSVTRETAMPSRWLRGEAELGRGAPTRLFLGGARAAGPSLTVTAICARSQPMRSVTRETAMPSRWLRGKAELAR